MYVCIQMPGWIDWQAGNLALHVKCTDWLAPVSMCRIGAKRKSTRGQNSYGPFCANPSCVELYCITPAHC